MSKASKILVFILLLFCVTQTSLSLDPKKSLKQYILEKWNTDNGLPQNAVVSMVQDNDGYMWFATQEGAVRFDGSKFTVFDRINTPEFITSNIGGIAKSPDGTLWFIGNFRLSLTTLKNGKFKLISRPSGWSDVQANDGCIDSSGNGWLATNQGLIRFDNDQQSTFTHSDGLPSDTLYLLYPDREHRLWISSPSGLCVYDKGKFHTYTVNDGLLSDTINDIYEDRSHAVWLVTNKGLCCFNNGQFTSFNLNEGSKKINVTTVFETRNKDLFIGTSTGLRKFDNGSFTYIPNKDGSPGLNIKGIYEDQEGTIWVIPYQKGILRLKDGVLESLTMAEGLSENDVRTVFEDNEGSLWIGTYGAGLNRLRESKFITYSTDEGLSQNLVQSVLEDNDHNWWIGTFSAGINKYKDGKNTILTTRDGLPSNAIQGLLQDRTGAIWIGTDSGFAVYQHNKITKYTTKDGLLNNYVQAFFEDTNGDILIGSVFGITKYSHGKLSIIYHNEAGSVFVMNRSHDGKIWAGGFRTLGTLNEGVFTPYALPDSLQGIFVFSLYEDASGTLWIGTAGNGILRLKDGKISSITPRAGLFDFNAYCLLEDEYGNLWSDCNKGIYRVSIKELNDYCDGKIPSISCVVYGTADGMKMVECNGGTTPNAFRMHDGRLAFSTVKGLATIYPSDIKLNTVPPPVIIERFYVEQKQYDPHSINVFAPGTEKFEFDFSGISFMSGNKVRFKYKLEPFETEWVEAGNRREAFYTHIPHGEYTFKVIAANSDGIWNQTGATTSFVLKPYFYETSFFIVTCVIGFIFIGPSIYLVRVRNMKRREEELTAIVDARTADLKKEKENVEHALKDLKEAQNQLVLSEKMASLGQLTAGIAHEIKNPLNFVNNFSALSTDLMSELQDELNKKKELFDEKEKANIQEIIENLQLNVTKINEHGKRADSIVRGMLLHSRGKTGERQQTDLNALLSEYTNLAYHGMRAQDASFNVKIETNFDDSIGKVNIVPQDLSRVFLNIINNGCYAANDRKKHAPNGFVPTITVSSKNLGDKFEVRIKDNGMGIPKSVLDKIYNPFFTTKPAGAGTGLGLSMSYDIVTQEHKGELKVETKEGEFAEFIITIPKNLA